MQAIETTFYGPTNHRGSRIKVSSARGSVWVSWDYALDVDANHAAACLAALRQWKWGGHWIGGGRPDQKGSVYVCLPGSMRTHPEPSVEP